MNQRKWCYWLRLNKWSCLTSGRSPRFLLKRLSLSSSASSSVWLRLRALVASVLLWNNMRGEEGLAHTSVLLQGASKQATFFLFLSLGEEEQLLDAPGDLHPDFLSASLSGVSVPLPRFRAPRGVFCHAYTRTQSIITRHGKQQHQINHYIREMDLVSVCNSILYKKLWERNITNQNCY